MIERRLASSFAWFEFLEGVANTSQRDIFTRDQSSEWLPVPLDLRSKTPSNDCAFTLPPPPSVQSRSRDGVNFSPTPDERCLRDCMCESSRNLAFLSYRHSRRCPLGFDLLYTRCSILRGADCLRSSFRPTSTARSDGIVSNAMLLRSCAVHRMVGKAIFQLESSTGTTT